MWQEQKAADGEEAFFSIRCVPVVAEKRSFIDQWERFHHFTVSGVKKDSILKYLLEKHLHLN